MLKEESTDALPHPGYGTFIAVWVALVLLTGALVLLSHFGLRAAVWGLLTITPRKGNPSSVFLHASEI